MSTNIAIDAGQTAVRGIAITDGRRSGIIRAGGVVHLANPGAPAHVSARLLEVIERLRSSQDAVEIVSIGLSGFTSVPNVLRRLAEELMDASGARRVCLASDGVAAYVGALGLDPGVSVAVGTGVVVLASDGLGKWKQSDGWGYLLGDQGGGYWIGRAGLEQALRASDGRGGSAALLRQALLQFGSVQAIVAAVYGTPSPAHVIAGFAPRVAHCARTGDASSREIWAIAVDRVVESTVAAASLLHATSSLNVACTGSILRARDLFLAPFIRLTAVALPGAVVSVKRSSGLGGARKLGDRPTETASLFPGLVAVFGSEEPWQLKRAESVSHDLVSSRQELTS